ncbi:dTDP-4-deoxyrhamnose-3,5-epimerase [Bacteroidales bacterium]|nr:dTDP-4-deoxyrhamnose-3,5-epimerase [Bacteroidales bacterium]
MNYIETEIKGLWILEPKVHLDGRGYFMETYKKEEFDKYIGKVDFIQDNESQSNFGVLRGLHFQKGAFAQAKLVRVLHGMVLDVAVDIRKDSDSFGKFVMIELSADNKKQFFVPRGFAHGFLVMSETAIFSYKVDNVYKASSEDALLYSDPTVGIEWPLRDDELVLSSKDKEANSLENILRVLSDKTQE